MNQEIQDRLKDQESEVARLRLELAELKQAHVRILDRNEELVAHLAAASRPGVQALVEAVDKYLNNHENKEDLRAMADAVLAVKKSNTIQEL